MEAMKRYSLWEPFKALMASNTDVADVWNAATAVKRNFPMIEDMKAAGEKDFVIQFRTEDAAGTITIQPKSILVLEKIG